MKKYLLAFLIFFCKTAFCQLNDPFEDGDFTFNPVWSGSNGSADFTIIANRLRSNSVTTGSNFYLSTANSLATNCTWEFYCNLQFNTSGANYVDVYLIANQADLQNADINGYFIRIGNTDDEISLYKRTGAQNTSIKIIDGANDSFNTSNNIAKIKVTRTAENLFILERDLTGTGSAYITEGSVTDADIISSTHFGIYIQQSTASFIQEHFFDDVKIEAIIPDVTPPTLLSALAIDTLTVDAIFSEAMDSVSAKLNLNYMLNNGTGNPVSVSTTSDNFRYRLLFSNSLNTANYTLTVINVKDLSNNMISINNTADFNFVKPYIAKPHDLIINEVFADPSPQIDLPTVEFIELFNTSTNVISLKNWIYSDTDTQFTFTKDSILPGEYLILCAKADTAEFKSFGRVLGISPWPSLNNSGDVIKLHNDQNTLIDLVAYTDSWYREPVKKAGGWTLELINPNAVCSGIQNWIASTDASGGTPGRKNAVYLENTGFEPLKLMSALLVDSVTISLNFNKSIDSLSASVITNYNLNNGIGNPIVSLPVSPFFDQVILKFGTPIARGNTYKITLANLTDCAGALIDASAISAEFIFPKKITKNDILINEVLFNPRTDGVDFVEIYNHSENVLNLQELSLATIAKDTISSEKQLSTSELLLRPGEYLVLTKDPDNVKQEYNTQNPNAFLKLSAMPSFNDDAGTVILLSNNIRIDQLDYTEKMHFPLIKDKQGVSLERSDFKRPANETGNFRSAASSVGFATPGYKNSQYHDNEKNSEELTLSSKTFSPDNDGFEDVLQINYKFDKPGLVANVTVYNNQGVSIRKLIKNISISTDGVFVWDGLNEFNERAAIGAYIIYADFFDLDGKIKKYRKTCVLATKFN